MRQVRNGHPELNLEYQSAVPARQRPRDNPWADVDGPICQSTRWRTGTIAGQPSGELAMRFLCLVYQEEEKLAALSQPEMEAVVGACIDWAEELERSGHHIMSAGLQSVRSAATVRIRTGKLITTDGPFAETKEFLGGFTLINARDIDEALQIAAKFPAAHLGSMEVRPVLEPGESVDDPLDQKILSAINRRAEGFNPFAPAKLLSFPQADSRDERPTTITKSAE
jgi:hypothetical protein